MDKFHCKDCGQEILVPIAGELLCWDCFKKRNESVQTREHRLPCYGCGKLKFQSDPCQVC